MPSDIVDKLVDIDVEVDVLEDVVDIAVEADVMVDVMVDNELDLVVCGKAGDLVNTVAVGCRILIGIEDEDDEEEEFVNEEEYSAICVDGLQEEVDF